MTSQNVDTDRHNGTGEVRGKIRRSMRYSASMQEGRKMKQRSISLFVPAKLGNPMIACYKARCSNRNDLLCKPIVGPRALALSLVSHDARPHQASG